MSARKAIGKKLRFEVFKRDSFTCQYCGGKAPDVILHVDHISPVAKGGGNDILNLITSCQQCNLGKGPRTLTDRAEIEKQRAQLDELNERRLQLEAMVEWRESLREVETREIDLVANTWNEASGYTLLPSGLDLVAKLITRFGVSEVMEAATIARKYFKWSDGGVTSQSVETALQKIGGICFNRANPDRSNFALSGEPPKPQSSEQQREQAYTSDANDRVARILQELDLRIDEQFSSIDACRLIRNAMLVGVSDDTLMSLAANSRSYEQFERGVTYDIETSDEPNDE